MESAIFGFIGALIGAILGFIGSLTSSFGRSKDVQLDVRTKVITNERAQWRKNLRELTATFVALALRISETAKEGDEFELERTRILIRLRLNSNPKHKLDSRLLALLPLISSDSKEKSSDLNSKLEEFEATMQALLKQEWEKSKDEANTGNIAATEKGKT